ncbi:MAG: PmoA family protein [Pirellulaceae bacterium]
MAARLFDQNHHRDLTLLTVIVSVCLLSAGTTLAQSQRVKLTEDDDKIVVTIDGQPFTNYVHKGHAKPIFFPVIGPHEIPMTRSYPMVKDVDNEASDHPHHKSLWYTHDDVNGVKFWIEYDKDEQPVYGKIVPAKTEIIGDAIHTDNQWRTPDGKVVCSDRRVIRFGADDHSRFIDMTITLRATDGDVVFGDTKEGTMGIRTNPSLRLKADPKRGNHTAAGQSINSEGVEGKAMWGKRAKWVDYWAPINEHIVGIAIMDHPSNPRHPTWWHARDYGLIAANPFGVHDFEGKPVGTGDLTIKDSESVSFRYRFVFHEGDVKEAKIEQAYEAFAGE